MKLALPEESSSFLTLILNGIGSIDQLTMLKSIIHAAVMSAWNLTLEASYIFDSSASFIPETFEKSPSISPVDDKGVASVSDVPFGPLSSSPLVVVHTPSIERRSATHVVARHWSILAP
uniref:Uncharacterized protein n=1 Tax=Spongospora subterranea TaxID=70186 RepID=A0A0H5R1Z6_9EUKA|eukprot:CRZ01824.1 hypothetical protein [Spongospora subterranea]